MIFFFNDTATTEIYTLSLHDALPIFAELPEVAGPISDAFDEQGLLRDTASPALSGLRQRVNHLRSEEHTSELQSQSNLVCRLLLEKKKLEAALLTGHRSVVRGARLPV